ncbi:uncharacterized [Tachysurus ichikawai]
MRLAAMLPSSVRMMPAAVQWSAGCETSTLQTLRDRELEKPLCSHGQSEQTRKTLRSNQKTARIIRDQGQGGLSQE